MYIIFPVFFPETETGHRISPMARFFNKRYAVFVFSRHCGISSAKMSFTVSSSIRPVTVYSVLSFMQMPKMCS